MSTFINRPLPGPEFVGPGEVADLLGVQRSTVRQWRRRKLLPPPAMTFKNGSGTGDAFPVWRIAEIRAWAQGRL